MGSAGDWEGELDRELVLLLRDLRARALSLTRAAAAADDLVQDVVERALLARRHLRADSNLRGWLLAIMKNLFIDTRRRIRRSREDPVVEWQGADEPGGPLDLLTMEDILAALVLLAPPEREIFSMAYLDCLSHREISARLSIPRNTVGTRLFRVRSKLRGPLLALYQRRIGAAE
jgi:RNA polymerase sigma-70 factor (ECF subfamily)